MHEMKPDLDKAKSLYNALPFSTVDNKTRLEIRELTDDLAQKNNPQVNERGPFPLNNLFGGAPINRFNHNRIGTNLVAPVIAVRAVAPVIAVARVDRTVANADLTVAGADPELNRVRNDTQNVHDSTVIRTIKNSINKLKSLCKITKTETESSKEIRTMLNELENNDVKKDAIMALDTIERNAETLSFSDMKENELLHLVWNRIHDDCNKDNCNNLKKNLVNELSESIEYGRPVCATGRFNRIIDTLNQVDPAVSIIPTYAIHDEMMNKASNLREEVLANYNKDDRVLINSVKPSLIQSQFETEFKNKIRTTMKTDYVDSNILTQSKMDSMIEGWIDYI